MAAKPLIPPVRWAQRKDRLYIKIDVDGSTQSNTQVKLDTTKLHFHADLAGKAYEIDLEFFGEVQPEESHWSLQPRYAEFSIKKKETGPYWERLLKAEGKQWFLKADWNHWKEEDEEEEDDQGFNLNNSSPFGMPGMGGMGMPGMGGMGMGGMGMGGMGMGGMGMPDMDFGDDEEEGDDLPPLEGEEGKEGKEGKKE